MSESENGASSAPAPPAAPYVGIPIPLDYLMTLYAPLDSEQVIDTSLCINNVRTGGWVKGPNVSGALIAPGGDWAHALPGGAYRLDIRAVIKTDDDALIYLTYNGVFKDSEKSRVLTQEGKSLAADDLYFIIAPTFRTAATAYMWLNAVQCIGKMISYKSNSHVSFDIFAAR